MKCIAAENNHRSSRRAGDYFLPPEPISNRPPCYNGKAVEHRGTLEADMRKDDEAIDLAQRHYEIEVGVTDIIRFTDLAHVEQSPGEPIKLLEVNENTVEAGIMPLYFGPAPESGIHYPSVIVEITPDEYRRLQANELSLPQGWRFAAPVPKPAPAANQ